MAISLGRHKQYAKNCVKKYSTLRFFELFIYFEQTYDRACPHAEHNLTCRILREPFAASSVFAMRARGERNSRRQ